MSRGTKRSLTAKLLIFSVFLTFVVNQVIAATVLPNCPKYVFTKQEGNFSSPGGGSGYGNNTCTRWFVEAPLSARVMVKFHGFDLEPSKTCKPYDFVLMQEHCNETTPWTNVGDYYCGNRTTFNITSSCGRVVITFRSDDSLTRAGFNASYKVIRDQQRPSIDCLGVNCTGTQTEVATTTVYLQCEVSGHPTPKTYWKRTNSAGVTISLPPKIRDENNGTLIIRDIREEDSGIYHCCANSTMGDDIKALKLHVKEKCKCPKLIRTNWYDLPPYVKAEENKDPTGVFPILIQRILNTCCGNCTRGDGPSIINYDKPQDSLESVKQTINDQDTIEMSFPITGKKDDRTFNNDKKFYPLFSSPGVAFIVVDAAPGTSAKAVFDSVLGGWPVLLLTLLMALLSGQVMWALDTWYNPDEFPRSFIKGSGEGFWWAFVTMTTVGYGDRSPRGFLARIFAIVWVLIGIVITSVFTGVVTTSLTAITLSTDVKLYGTKVGAVQNSTEYKLGINKNANMRSFQNLDELVSALKNRKDGLKGALVDTYVAGEVNEFSDEGLRVNKIVDYSSYYGIVFGDGQMAENDFQKCLDEYVLVHKAGISKTVEDKTSPMKKPTESAAVEKSSGLFDAESQLFKDAVYTCLGLLLFLTALGILWDYGYIRHWRKKSELDELEMIGGPGYEIAKHNMEMMDSMMREVQEFYENWTKRLDDICAKHEEQQKLLAKRQGGKK